VTQSDLWKVEKRLTKRTKQTKKKAELLRLKADHLIEDSTTKGKSESISTRVVNKKGDLLLSRRKKR